MNTPNSNGFLLIFHTDESYNQLSLDQLQDLIQRNTAWKDQLAAEGRIQGGQALERKGAMVAGKNGRFVTDGPFAEAKEAIGGFLWLKVGTLAEAVAIARRCPGLDHGRLEVRPVADACPLDARARELAQREQLAA